MPCVTGVYSKHITNSMFVILHLNASHLSVCSSCFKLVLADVNFDLVQILNRRYEFLRVLTISQRVIE